MPRRSLIVFALLAAAPLLAQNLPPGTRPADSTTEASPLDAPESAIAAHNYADARDQLLKLVAQPLADSTQTARALYDLGYAYDALNDTASAEQAYRKAIATDPSQFESHAALGLLLIDRDPVAARSELSLATTLAPATDSAAEKAQVDRALARLIAHSNPTLASEELLAAIRLTGESPADTLLTAEISEALGDYSDAEVAYRRTLTDPSAGPDAAYALGGMLIRANNLSGAVSILQPALIAHPESAPLAAQLARAYILQGDDAKAVPLLATAHTQHPDDAATTRMLADACAHSGDYARADKLYAQLLAATPDDVFTLASRGDELIRAHQFNDAYLALERADKLFIANPASLPNDDSRAALGSALAFAASETGRPDTVLLALDQRLNYAEETPSTLFLRATAHDHLGHRDLARSYYNQFLAAAGGHYPNEEWEARHRLVALAGSRSK